MDGSVDAVGASADRAVAGAGDPVDCAVDRAVDDAVWEFDVGVSTHDLLRVGVTVHHYRRVRVVEDGYQRAALLACQMAAFPEGVLPTDLLWRH